MNDTVAETAAAPEGSTEPTAPASTHTALRILLMVIAGVAATGISTVVIDRLGEFGQLPEELAKLTGNISTEQQQELDSAQFDIALRNAVTRLAIIGAILGGLLTLTIACLRRAGSRMLLGLFAGILLGGAAGALAGYTAVSLHSSLRAAAPGGALPETKVMLVHGITWGLVGLAVGLAAGLNTRQVRTGTVVRSMVTAGVLAALAGVAFPIVAGVAAPLVNTSLPFPDAATGRLLWMGLPAVLMGIGLGRGG